MELHSCICGATSAITHEPDCPVRPAIPCLVTRLRERAAGGLDEYGVHCDIEGEAAEEIERLRAAMMTPAERHALYEVLAFLIDCPQKKPECDLLTALYSRTYDPAVKCHPMPEVSAEPANDRGR